MPLPAVQERSVWGDDKMANAPELSLRGGRRPTWQFHATGYVFAGNTLLSDRILRDSHVASLLGMTRQGNAAVHQRPCAVECFRTGRSLSAATDAIGLYVFVGSLCELRALLGLPRPLRGLAMAKLVAWHHRTNVIKIPEAGRSRGFFFAFELKWHTGSYRAGNRSRGGPAAPCACPARRYGRGRAQE